MILVMYVIPCILSHDFHKLTILYIHVHISLSFLWQISLKWLSDCQWNICLSVCLIKWCDFWGDAYTSTVTEIPTDEHYIIIQIRT